MAHAKVKRIPEEYIKLSSGRMIRIPDFENWEKTGTEISTGKHQYLVAPCDIVDVDGLNYFSFEEALEIFEMLSKYDWKLASAVEWLQIISAIADGEDVVSSDLIMKELKLDLVGYGVSVGKNSGFFAQHVGSEGLFWAGSVRPDKIIFPPPGKVLFISAKFECGIHELLQHERGAAVRLIKQIA